MGKSNLKVPTPEEARELGRRGGLASGRARRERKDMRETFRDMLDMPLRPGSTSDARTLDGLKGKNVTVGQAIALQMMRAAMDGDVRAAEFVRDTSGQRPTQQVEVTRETREAAEAFRALLDGEGEDAADERGE